MKSRHITCITEIICMHADRVMGYILKLQHPSTDYLRQVASYLAYPKMILIFKIQNCGQNIVVIYT